MLPDHQAFQRINAHIEDIRRSRSHLTVSAFPAVLVFACIFLRRFIFDITHRSVPDRVFIRTRMNHHRHLEIDILDIGFVDRALDPVVSGFHQFNKGLACAPVGFVRKNCVIRLVFAQIKCFRCNGSISSTYFLDPPLERSLDVQILCGVLQLFDLIFFQAEVELFLADIRIYRLDLQRIFQLILFLHLLFVRFQKLFFFLFRLYGILQFLQFQLCLEKAVLGLLRVICKKNVTLFDNIAFFDIDLCYSSAGIFFDIGFIAGTDDSHKKLLLGRTEHSVYGRYRLNRNRVRGSFTAPCKYRENHHC